MAKLEVHRYAEELIQNLGFSFVFTNSERNQLSCPRKWFFSYSQRLSTKGTSKAFGWGIAWHMIMEDLFLYWKEHDKSIKYGHPYLEESIKKARLFLIDEYLNPEQMIPDMRIALKGYLDLYGDIVSTFKVLEVEKPLRFPICDFKGDHYQTNVFLEDCGNYYKLANDKTLNKVEKIMPFYVVGRADAIVQDRDSGKMFIYDHKTTSSIKRFLSSNEVDPQLCSYAAMLEYEKTYGYLKKYNQYEVGGVIYGLTSNGSTNPPKKLKDGTYSKAKTTKTPTWVYKSVVSDQESYKDFFAQLKKDTDPLWHRREWIPLDRKSMERWKIESYGIARRIADMYRNLFLYENSEGWVAPRIPVCKTSGYCQFKELCAADNDLLRSNYKVEEKLIWRK